MKYTILIVDENKDILSSLKEGFERSSESYTVLIESSPEGIPAHLKSSIFLAVVDFSFMLNKDISLWNHIKNNYPDISLLITYTPGSRGVEGFLDDDSNNDFIKKPVSIEDLLEKATETISDFTKGGVLEKVPSGIFLQILKMEKRTCTIRIYNETIDKYGVLFFDNGNLYDARLNDIYGETAAYEIFLWDSVDLFIENRGIIHARNIDHSLDSIMFNAMKDKDEDLFADTQEKLKKEDEKIRKKRIEKEFIAYANKLIRRIQKKVGEKHGIQKIQKDNSWKNLIKDAESFGSIFNSGKLKLAYIRLGTKSDQILLPSFGLSVISVDPKCPRDRIMQVLSDKNE